MSEFVAFRRFAGLHAGVRCDVTAGACLEPFVPRACLAFVDETLEPRVGDIVAVTLADSVNYDSFSSSLMLKRLVLHGGELAFSTNRYTLRLPGATITGVLVATLTFPAMEKLPGVAEVVAADERFYRAARARFAPAPVGERPNRGAAS